MDAQNAKQEIELTAKEIRQIKRYCIFPGLVIPAVIGALIAPVVTILLIMINQIALNTQTDHDFKMLLVMVGIFVAWTCIYVCCFLGPCCGIRGKKWKRILEKIAVAQASATGDNTISSGVGLLSAGRLMRASDSSALSAAGAAAQIAGTIQAMAVVGNQTKQVKEHALAVARMSGIRIPSVRKYQLMLSLLPSLLMILLFVPIFRESVLDNRQMDDIFYARMEQMEEALQDDFIVRHKDDPYHSDSEKCTISFEAKNDAQAQELDVTFGVKGTIEELSWEIGEDDALSREENIQRFQEYINTTAEKILSANIPLWLEPPEHFFSMPAPVVEEFLQIPENEDPHSFIEQDGIKYHLTRYTYNSNRLYYSLGMPWSARY